MSTPEADRLLVELVDFLVPCRRFFIKANVTLDRQLPVVDEFVLRLVRTAEPISVRRLRRFFAFSEAEAEVVLLDLTEHGLISVTGEDVSLTPNGHELFKHVQDDQAPRLAEIEVREEAVWFDLISKNMMRGTSFRPAPNLIPLEEQPRARALPEAYAREAFETNFRDFARRIMRHPEADRLAIYSVSDVLPAGFAYQPMRAEAEINVRDAIDQNLTFPSLAENPLKFRELASAGADRWERLRAPAPSAGGIAEYERITGDRRPAKLAETRDPDAWLALVHERMESTARPTIGPPYLPKITESICRAISEARKLSGEAAASASLIWARPGGDLWGRSSRVGECLASIRDALRARGAPDVETLLVIPRAVPSDLRRAWRRVFDRGLLAPSGQLPADMEVLLVPGVVAHVSIYVPFRSGALCVGSITRDAATLQRLERRLRRESGDSEPLWASDGAAGGAESHSPAHKRRQRRDR